MTAARPTIGEVFTVVANHYHCPTDLLRVSGRAQPNIEAARKVVARLLYDECRLTWGAVAEALGYAWKSGSLIQTANGADPQAAEQCREALYGL
jgi:chromosomal replication initiation ATPase DnaA